MAPFEVPAFSIPQSPAENLFLVQIGQTLSSRSALPFQPRMFQKMIKVLVLECDTSFI